MNSDTKSIRALGAVGDWIDRQIPENLLADPEASRRARIITRFGLLGSIFGLMYALFYLLIGHLFGAGIVILCTIGVALTPLLMLWKKAIEPAGHFFAATLTLGFLGLCFVEGGVHGHAIAWLVSVPLCALLLLGDCAAAIWVVVVLFAAGLVVGCDLAGVDIPATYPARWAPLVSAAGYLGLVLFMAILGLLFETGRAKAYARLQEALQELRTTNERLVYVNQEKNEFLGIVAHDLKNPLTVIMANGDMMKIIEDPTELHRMADKIISASERMRRLIKDLLDANAIEQGLYASNIEPCEMGALVSEIVEQNFTAAQNKQIEFRLGVTDNVHIHTDSAAALQILDNLISNAVKYSPHNSTIHVHLMPEQNHALVLVRDEGPGISEEDQKKLFQKFSRLSARPTGGESSTGLGLSIAKRLANTLGGDIQCRSALGAGTTFALRLPLGNNGPHPLAPAADAGDILRERAPFVLHRN